VQLLKYDGSERITAREALRHVYFKEMRYASPHINHGPIARGSSRNALA
jgi:hypothetical protein